MIANGHDLTNGIWYVNEHDEMMVACPACYRFLPAEDAYAEKDSGMPWSPCPSFEGFALETWRDHLEGQIENGNWSLVRPGQMSAFTITRLY